MKRQIAYLAVVLLVAASVRSYGDYAFTEGSGKTAFAFTCFSTKVCGTATLVSSAGAEAGVAALPLQVSLANTAANGTAILTTGTGGTFPATQSGTWTVQPGNTANTTPWLQIIRDAAGNARGANVDASNRLSVSCDNGCSASTAITGWAGSTLGAITTYGTAPSGIVPGVNAFVTNTNANGQGTMANSSPVTIASNQTANALWGHGATGAAAPANITYAGVLASGATGGLTRGLINCDSHVFKHITSATDTLAVQGVTSQIIYVCGWRSRAAGVATWFLENTASVNANCSSSNTQITGVATEAANTGEVNNNPIWGGLKNTVSNGLCINSTGTGGVDIDIWYAQF